MLLADNSTRLAAIAAAVILACISHAYCQSPLDDVVPNLPYTAQILQTSIQNLEDGSRERTETRIVTMRDSSGRTRIENFPCNRADCDRNGDKPNVVNLYIPLRRQFIQLMPGSKTARVMTFLGTGPIPTHANSSPTNVITVQETLPPRTINGIYATGTRIKTMIPSSNGQKVEAPDVEEHWVSPELKVTVLDKYVDPHHETIDEVQQLDRSEPDPALFEIPADYKIVNVTD